jgi:hypothetical protein
MPAEPRAPATRAAVRRAQIPLVCIGRSAEPAERGITTVTGIWPPGPASLAGRRGPDPAHAGRAAAGAGSPSLDGWHGPGGPRHDAQPGIAGPRPGAARAPAGVIAAAGAYCLSVPLPASGAAGAGCAARSEEMFERFTDRARRVVVLAQEEAGMLNHDYIGTEHILLGLIGEGEGVAAKALESLGISLEAVRQQVEEISGQGQQAPSGHIPFTPRAKKVLELSLREALQLGHNYIGTEHILLGLIGEGEGVAARVLARLGADLNRVRQQVIRLLHGYQGKEPAAARAGPAPRPAAVTERRLLARLQARLAALESRLPAIEQRVGTGAETRELDRQIERVRGQKAAAAGAQDYEQAASLRDQENHLLAEKEARQQDWHAAHPGLPALAERCSELSQELDHLRALLREHGIEPEGKTA